MIHFYEARTPAELMGIVIYLKTLLKAQLKGTKLIIIDSFSSIFRSMFAEYAKMIQLQAEFFLELNKLVRKFNIMVSRRIAYYISSFSLLLFLITGGNNQSNYRQVPGIGIVL